VSLLPPLVGAGQLYDALGDQHLRLFDATVFLRRAVQGGPYTVESGASGYEESHIPTAAFADIPGELSDPTSPFPFTVPDAERFAAAIGRLGVGDDSHVVAYAQESPMWATRLWWLLKYFGHDDVSVLDGGLVAWRGLGGALERGARYYEEASFTPRTRSGRLATLDEVKAVAEGPPVRLVNALPVEAFRGEGPGAYSRPGRIPSSVSVPWSDLVDPGTNRFRAPDRLSAAFADSGVEEDEPVIAYCGGGISATVDLFALELTGRSDGRLYDGDELLYVMAADRVQQGQALAGVVGTLMTNLGVEVALRERGLEFVRAPVGDRYVLEELVRRGWPLGGGRYRPHAVLPQRKPQADSARDQNRRAAGQPLRDEPRRGLRRRHNVSRRRGDAEASELLGDGARRARSVVGHKRQPHSVAPGLRQRLRRAGYPFTTEINHAVQVE